MSKTKGASKRKQKKTERKKSRQTCDGRKKENRELESMGERKRGRMSEQKR